MTPPLRPLCAATICLAMMFARPATILAAAQDPATPQKYKITILEDASKTKRGKKGRVSSDTVVKVTDENNVPVAGIAVAFAITKASGAAAFTGGSMSTVVTTNAVGLASSGSFTATTASTFTMSVTASVPGGAITASVPVTGSALGAGAAGGTSAGAGGGGAGAGAGMSTGLIAGIVAGVAAAAVGIGLGVASGGNDSRPGPPAGPRGAISIGSGGVTFGPPR
jgi:hypothetical protein